MDYSNYFWQGNGVRLRPLSVDDAEGSYIASINLHKKVGFVQEGIRRRHVFLNGEFVDEILFGLTREEFEENEEVEPSSNLENG